MRDMTLKNSRKKKDASWDGRSSRGGSTKGKQNEGREVSVQWCRTYHLMELEALKDKGVVCAGKRIKSGLVPRSGRLKVGLRRLSSSPGYLPSSAKWGGSKLNQLIGGGKGSRNGQTPLPGSKNKLGGGETETDC